jgi:hypothetical protein
MNSIFQTIKYFSTKNALNIINITAAQFLIIPLLFISLTMVCFYTLIFATLASVYALSPEASSKLKSELAAGNIIPKSIHV